MRIVISFDIDGTLEMGDPPGPITLEMVRKAKELGCIIGSCSDRSLSAQQDMWTRSNIEADFVSLKHVMSGLKERFEAEHYLHIGDRNLDEQFAREAGFDFCWMDAGAEQPWLAMLNGSKPE